LSDDFIVINDKLKRFARGLYAKQKEGERELDRGKELDRGETDRERECV
jgi:hypothetical protein